MRRSRSLEFPCRVAAALLLAMPATAQQDEPEPIVSTLEVGGIKLRVTEMGEGPVVLFLHGFPELAFSWRHQLRALAAAGYRAVAPDMRGFGGSSAPREDDRYDAIELCGDVTGLLDVLEVDRAVLVGHDWGAAVAWYAALLDPDRFHALVAMSVPWGPRSKSPPMARMRATYGDNFFYMLYFQEDAAEAELDADPRGLLRRFLASPNAVREKPAITSPKASAGGLLGRIGLPKEPPDWLTQEELDTYVEAFDRTGFRGGLNYYRNFDRSWELTPQLQDATFPHPTLFIAGEFDLVIRGRTAEQLEGPMKQVAPKLRPVDLIEGAGHWIQQERAAEVNAMLLEFLASLPAVESQRRKKR